MKRALDTNVLVRFLTDDDRAQADRVAALIDTATDRKETLYVGHIVLCELVSVLRSAYRRSKAEVVLALRQVLTSRQLEIEDPPLALQALRLYERGSGDFSDYLIAQRATCAGYTQVVTFDKKLLRETGFFAP